jgi:hypothetical protein
MRFHGQLIKAQLEQLSADPTGANAVESQVYYNTSSKKVRFYNGTIWADLGSGGGGGALAWIEDLDAPLTTVDNNNRVYCFQSAAGQALYALIKVPASYSPGSPIKLNLNFYSPDTSGTALLQAVSTLIRQGTDAISSTTNQRTTTNAAVSLSAGTVNIPQAVQLDLTDTTGRINAVAVAAGDYIKVKLQRGTDTATSDLKVPVYGAEVVTS